MNALASLSQKILPVLFWLLIMLAFDTPAMTVMTVLAAVLHELGHIAAAMAVGYGDISLPRAALTGLRILPHRMMSYREEVVIAVGGPLANAAVFSVLTPFFGNDYVFAFALINILTAISNLIPVSGYDGYRIISALVCSRLSPATADTLMGAVSTCFSAVAVFVSLFLMMKIGEGYWLFAIFFAVLFKETVKMQKRIKIEDK